MWVSARFLVIENPNEVGSCFCSSAKHEPKIGNGYAYTCSWLTRGLTLEILERSEGYSTRLNSDTPEEEAERATKVVSYVQLDHRPAASNIPCLTTTAAPSWLSQPGL